MATIKILKLKIGICRRTCKEYNAYEKEVEMELEKLTAMKDSGADPHDIKQQENVLGESRMMIPDCRKRLEAALYDLQAVIAEAEEDKSLQESEELEVAKKLNAELEPLVEAPAINTLV
ncbi:hypothetical protein O6H91_18G022700 [Diphasiastrum complanatum]|uniref:Uncharacterized protein n=1 Tax=Diphasiastrum complanatum TaxID=34168 RepID=A0ACC2AYT6_DIPCM|nr:hypothetical protein O6H91_18G022700 [Diphasiastrum complanatum]